MRFRAMSSHNQVESRKLKCLVRLLVILLGTKLAEKLRYVVKAILSRYHCLNFERATDRALRPIPRRLRTIVSFNISDVKIFIRFQREHLVLLLRLLRFPDVATLTNRCRMTGEEVLLRGLYELTTGMSKHNIATNVFGGDGPLQSVILLTTCMTIFMFWCMTTSAGGTAMVSSELPQKRLEKK